jgi:hypothetical protein
MGSIYEKNSGKKYRATVPLRVTEETLADIG